MSDRPLRHAAALVLALTCLTPCAAALGAQTAAEMSQRIHAMQDSLQATRARYDARRARATLPLNDSIVTDGVTVLFHAALAARDRAAVRQGIADARSLLDTRFGAGAAKLVEGTVWSIMSVAQFDGRAPTAGFVEGRVPRERSRVAGMPLRAEDVEDVVLQRAAHRLLDRAPVVAAFTAGTYDFNEQDRPLYIAQKMLALSASSVARRCAAGAIGACRTILDSHAADQWFAATDTVPPNGRAIPPGVKASVLGVALELGGTRVIDALARPQASDDAVAILADAAGVTPDSLLHSWTTQLQAAATETAAPPFPLAATAAFWCGIFLLAATRRRPQ